MYFIKVGIRTFAYRPRSCVPDSDGQCFGSFNLLHGYRQAFREMWQALAQNNWSFRLYIWYFMFYFRSWWGKFQNLVSLQRNATLNTPIQYLMYLRSAIFYKYETQVSYVKIVPLQFFYRSFYLVGNPLRCLFMVVSCQSVVFLC